MNEFQYQALRQSELRAALAKASTTFDVVDPSVDLLTPTATLIILDFDRLEREVLKRSIADGDVQKLLPFNTVLVAGEHHFHILNTSAYDVETNSHVIQEGSTLCAKAGAVTRCYLDTWVVTCPGCIAKGKAIIVNHLLDQEVR